MIDVELVRRIYYQTRSVEETARQLEIPLYMAHQLITQVVGEQPVINEHTFTQRDRDGDS